MPPFSFNPPRILTVPDDFKTRPFWSVAIPTFNARPGQLEQALRSVLDQAPGPEEMEILVVDDCSPKGSSGELVKRIGGDRVQFHRNEKNLGLPRIWNDCISRSRGRWVHILHQDDYLLPGFYQRVVETARQHPEVSLIATRCFYVNDQGIIEGVSLRLKELEQGGHSVKSLFYDTPIQCPAVVVQRTFYEKHGGFLPELVFTPDREMWARAISLGGGVVIPEVLSCYRQSNASETGRLARTGENWKDLDRCSEIFASRYEGFNMKSARQKICSMALDKAMRLRSSSGENSEALEASWNYWNANASFPLRMRKSIGRLARTILNEESPQT